MTEHHRLPHAEFRGRLTDRTGLNGGIGNAGMRSSPAPSMARTVKCNGKRFVRKRLAETFGQIAQIAARAVDEHDRSDAGAALALQDIMKAHARELAIELDKVAAGRPCLLSP